MYGVADPEEANPRGENLEIRQEFVLLQQVGDQPGGRDERHEHN
jgi:hypothetical protein